MTNHQEDVQGQDKTPRRLTLVSSLGSLLLAAALFWVHRVFHSQLALAQAADSLFDMVGGVALVWALHVSTRPADPEHPQGHSLAQPIAALVVAVLAGVLAGEVLHSAFTALFSVARPALAWPVAVVFGAKVVFKVAVVALASQFVARRRSPALAALRMDARNDVLVGSLALLGLILERAGLPRVDPALALGVAVYIAYAGLRLGRENASLLMGESASPARRQQLAALARSVPGVQAAGSVVAVWRGSLLHVQLSIAVDSSLTLRAAHDIGHAVEQRLLAEPDVGHVVAHVEPG